MHASNLRSEARERLAMVVRRESLLARRPCRANILCGRNDAPARQRQHSQCPTKPPAAKSETTLRVALSSWTREDGFDRSYSLGGVGGRDDAQTELRARRRRWYSLMETKHRAVWRVVRIRRIWCKVCCLRLSACVRTHAQCRRHGKRRTGCQTDCINTNELY